MHGYVTIRRRRFRRRVRAMAIDTASLVILVALVLLAIQHCRG